MINPQAFVDALYQLGYTTLTGVPCSFFTDLLNCTLNDKRFRYVMANNEGEALAIASGFHLAGKKTCVMLQNSGLGNLVNPLASLNYPFEIPVLIIVTWRGQPGVKDEPQHALMGQTMRPILDLLKVPNEVVPEDGTKALGLLKQADNKIKETGLPYALVLQKNTFSTCALNTQLAGSRPPASSLRDEGGAVRLTRKDVLDSLMKVKGKDTLIVSTTGKTSRELYSHYDAPTNFYMVGSMGCAPSIALGLALGVQESKKVLVLDGDGAALMRLESMASVGHYHPSNLIHVLVDNGVHDSTGGQVTLSSTVRFGQIALACGYASSVELTEQDSFEKELARSLREPGPHFIRIKTKPGSPPDLPRPSVTPAQVKQRFMQFIQAN